MWLEDDGEEEKEREWNKKGCRLYRERERERETERETELNKKVFVNNNIKYLVWRKIECARAASWSIYTAARGKNWRKREKRIHLKEMTLLLLRQANKQSPHESEHFEKTKERNDQHR